MVVAEFQWTQISRYRFLTKTWSFPASINNVPNPKNKSNLTKKKSQYKKTIAPFKMTGDKRKPTTKGLK